MIHKHNGHTLRNESMPDFYSLSQYCISSFIFSTIRFCSARGGSGIKYSFALTSVIVPTVVPDELSLMTVSIYGAVDFETANTRLYNFEQRLNKSLAAIGTKAVPLTANDRVKLMADILCDVDKHIEPVSRSELDRQAEKQLCCPDSFVEIKHTKIVVAEYSVYRTETEITANLENERFERLIDSGAAEIVSSGEMQIDRNEKRDRKTGEIVRKRKKSPVLFLSVAGGVMLFSMAAFAVGKNFGRGTMLHDMPIESANVAEDGLIIPKQDEIADNAEQITVTIDRSYSAVPVEDLQLKGAVIKGKANILLPEFDKTDFFTHVPGYSWGFTSDPNGKKIEYYGGQAYDFTKDTKLYRVLEKTAAVQAHAKIRTALTISISWN